MATNTSQDHVSPPPRRWGRALLWLAAIVALVGAAVLVSFIAEDDTDVMAEEPLEMAQFCALAGRLGEVAELSLDGPEGVEQLRQLELVLRQLASLSPDTIADDFRSVADALRATSQVIASLPPDAPDAAALVTQSLDSELGAVSGQSDEAASYVERWCGPLSTTSTVPSEATSTSAPVEPSTTEESPG
jgi:hypothetical protein